MFPRTQPFKSISTMLVVALLLQPLLASLHPAFLPDSAGASTHAAAPRQSEPEDDTLYLPLVQSPGGGPDFVINSPLSNKISGWTYFSIQPAPAAFIDQVTFRAGSTVLETDDTPDDGFRIFLDAGELPAGPLELSATALSPGGERVRTKQVEVVADPPSSATVDSEGAALATESGSIITLPPGIVAAGTQVSVIEKDQQQVTEEKGIEWDLMDVTFLGAQEIQSSTPFTGPLSVASADFGSRVQPNQAVVNYRLVPDADGDGVAEIVVVNTASVAPNNRDVISDPVPQVQTNRVWTPQKRTTASPDQAAAISGPPGTLIQIAASGFNEASAFSNVAVYRSAIGEIEVELPLLVDLEELGQPEQIVTTFIPPLPAGPATLTLKNKSTASESTAIPITVENAPTLDQPAAQIIDDWFASTLGTLNRLTVMDEENNLAPPGLSMQMIFSHTTQLRADIQEFSTDPSPEEEQALNAMAALIQVFESTTRSGHDLDASSQRQYSGLCDSDYKADLELAKTVGLLMVSLSAALFLSGVGAPVAAAYLALGTLMTARAHHQLKEIARHCTEQTPSCGTSPSTAGSGTTGMGAAPPPGGSVCGTTLSGGSVVSGGGTGGNRQATARNSLAEPEPFIVKVYSAGSPIPFSGLVDTGGYFFIPLVPRDEPFTALAIDTATGATRTMTGTGPATGDSSFLVFNFLDETDDTVAIQIGEVITGAIESGGELHLYTFTATAGQRVYFDVQEQSGLTVVNWQLLDRTGTLVFDQALGSFEPGVQVLEQGGQYTLIVGEQNSTATGAYQFQLWNVPPPDTFTITVGDVISDGVPGPGAGHIETPGVKDVYTFTAAAGQNIFFDRQTQTGVNQLDWQVVDSAGDVLFNTCLGCFDPGLHTLTLGGIYTLTVGEDADDNTGSYSLQLWDVPPPDEFEIVIGNTISDGVPGPGAGNIEVAGAKDIYTFSATAGEVVTFEVLSQTGVNQVLWRLEDAEGTEIFNTCLGCFDPGTHTLEVGGTYTITVGNPNSDGHGTYEIRLSQ